MSTVETLVGRIGWHELVTPGVAKAKAFYTKLLGWETETFQPGEMDYEMVKVNGRNHGGFMSSDQTGGAPPHWIAYVLIKDAEKTAAAAKKAGGKVVHGPQEIPEVGTFVVVADPQGAVIAAISGESPTEGVPEGVFVWDELSTTDVEGAKGFYEAVLGWTSEDADMGGMGTYTIFQKGERQIAGAMHKMPGDSSPPHWLTYIGVDDIDGTTKKARDLGATIYVEPADIPGIGRFSIIADPTGAAVGLYRGES
jgi:predicted enzyme related to lactoylglutathione lyase